MSQLVLTNTNIATMDPKVGRPYGLIERAALAIKSGKIDWCGPQEECPAVYQSWRHEDMGGRLMTPALIDCHTHLVYGGNRAQEFEMRLNGATYEQIAQSGGGILSTVTATRTTEEKELLHSALRRIDALLAEGVQTFEVKSGYGLDQETELKMLRVARQISTYRPICVKTTFLGAHALPPGYKDRPADYIEEVCIPTLVKAHEEGLVDSVDAFCETIGFSTAELEPLFSCAQELNIPIKLHAEQLSNMGGTKMACAYNALTCDHLEYTQESDIIAMAAHDTVAVLLPGAYYFLRESQPPPIELFRRHRVEMAVATDCNPGSSPLSSLLLTMNMAATLFRLTPQEALAGTTRNAAKALGLKDCGQIKPKYSANLALWDVETPAELTYHIGFNPLYTQYHKGTRYDHSS